MELLRGAPLPFDDVLDAQIRIAQIPDDVWHASISEFFNKGLWNSIKRRIPSFQVDNLTHLTKLSATNGVPFYWSKPICELLSSASGSIPASSSISSSDIYTNTGFAYFEQGLQNEHTSFTVDGISWWPSFKMQDDDDGNFVSPLIGEDARLDDSDELRVFFWTKLGQGSLLVPYAEYRVPFGITLGEVRRKIGEDYSPTADLEGSRWKFGVILSMFAFINQQILTASSISPRRSVRKRATKAGLKHSDIRVVQLRKIRHRGNASQQEEVNWTCQWIVRGHWRAQWYPIQKLHKPLWILPHIKGPEGKPLKAKRQSGYAVVR